MLDAVIYTLIGFSAGCLAHRSIRGDDAFERSPRFSRYSVNFSFVMLSILDRLKRHYGFTSKEDVIVVAVRLLVMHSRAKLACFYEDGEWVRIEIRPAKGENAHDT